jgi:uncharacterized protein (DUF58 family)
MTRPTPKRRAYVALCAVSLLAGLAAGRPELVALAAPFGVVAALGAVRDDSRVEASMRLAATRVLEGEPVVLRVELTGAGSLERVELVPVATRGLRVRPAGPVVVRLDRGTVKTVELELLPGRWGVHPVGGLALRAHDALGLTVTERMLAPGPVLRAFPRAEALRRLVPPAGTQPAAGDWRSRQRGAGSELSEVRPYLPGDPARAINWRATARRRTPFVTERLADRAAEVVLFLDTFDDAGGTLDLAVRAAAALAREQLARRDRVGVVGYGGTLWYLEPGSGARQLQRIADALLESKVAFSYAWPDVRRVPRRALPPRATVIALTALEDERSVAALLNLRRRGYDMTVFELDSEPLVPEPRREPGRLARRLWRLEREALRARFARVGTPCVRWSPGRPLDSAVEEVRAWRRFAPPTTHA